MADENDPRMQISLGFMHTAICTDGGVIWTCGGGKFGQLGNERERNQNEALPIKDGFDNDFSDSLRGKTCVQISCGSQHTATITEDGSLYTWGHEANGRLGHGPPEEGHLSQSENGVGHPRNKALPMFVYAFVSHSIK